MVLVLSTAQESHVLESLILLDAADAYLRFHRFTPTLCEQIVRLARIHKISYLSLTQPREHFRPDPVEKGLISRAVETVEPSLVCLEHTPDRHGAGASESTMPFRPTWNWLRLSLVRFPQDIVHDVSATPTFQFAAKVAVVHVCRRAFAQTHSLPNVADTQRILGFVGSSGGIQNVNLLDVFCQETVSVTCVRSRVSAGAAVNPEWGSTFEDCERCDTHIQAINPNSTHSVATTARMTLPSAFGAAC